MLAAHAYNFAYVLCRWKKLAFSLEELHYFRSSKLGEIKLNKLWLGTGHSTEKPAVIDVLNVRAILPNILSEYFHFNPTLQIHNSHIKLFWRVSNYEMPLNYDKKGKPIGELTEKFVNKDFEHIVSGSLELDFEDAVPSNQETLGEITVINYAAFVGALDLPDKSIFFEDPRAHKKDGKYITAVARFGTRARQNQRFVNRMILIDSQESHAKIITSDHDQDFEKNWVVVEENESSLTMLQHSNPQVLVSVDKSTGYATTISKSSSSFIPEDRNLNGGSPFVLVDNSFYLRVARLQFTLGPLGRTRISLLVMHDLEFREVSRSVPFVFQEIGVEICNGFALNEDRFYFTWGKNDREMFIGTCSKNELLSWYENHKQS